MRLVQAIGYHLAPQVLGHIAQKEREPMQLLRGEGEGATDRSHGSL